MTSRIVLSLFSLLSFSSGLTAVEAKQYLIQQKVGNVRRGSPLVRRLDMNETEGMDFNETEILDFDNSTETGSLFEPSGTNETDVVDFNTTEILETNETEVFDFDNRQDTEAPTSNVTQVMMRMVEDPSSCMIYSDSVLSVGDCDAAGEDAVWEVVESEEPILFQLRHSVAQLCLPENPGSPGQEFMCWHDEKNQAIADRINGLTDCAGQFVAYVGFIDVNHPSYLYNAICSKGEIGAGTDVVLMSYTLNGQTQVLWGEKVLLDIPEITAGAPFSIDGKFVMDVVA